MNELTPLQRAEIEVARAAHQPDYLALSLQTTQRLAESNAVQAAALAQVAQQAPAARRTITPAELATYVLLGGVLVALLLTVAIAAPSVLALWLVARKMLNKEQRK
ncbi:hypothetical protein ACFPA8_07720 [Streptomyces ovatisporus]|uniref:Uncharacterized protein n=1 Tax=Streptomyces ovatisporus TaxID=1128682 RepID=A0ABV9A2A1_9ACTN